MGNGPYNYIHSNITNEHSESLDEKKKNLLNNLYQQFTRKNGYLTQENFKRILRLDNEENSDLLFDIFKHSRGKMYLKELFNLYVAFVNKDLMNFLFSFLILGNKDKMGKDEYKKIIHKFIKINKNFEILNTDECFKSVIVEKANNLIENFEENNINNQIEICVSKKLLIEYLKTHQKDLGISFHKKIKPSSDLITKNNYLTKNYVCDCLIEQKKIEYGDIIEQIEKPFLSDKLIVKGHLPFDNLKKMMQEYSVNVKLINLIVKYLEISTMKNSIIFSDFKNLISCITLKNSEQEKKNLLFRMILAIYNGKESIKGSQLKEIFNIQNEECKLDEDIDKNKFDNLDDPIIKKETISYIQYMENLILLVYIRYNLKVEDESLKKKIINFILNKKTAEEYLIENFDKFDKFYPVNKQFWDSLIKENPGENETELKINNSLIAEIDQVYNIPKKEEEKNKDNNLTKKNNAKENKNINQAKKDKNQEKDNKKKTQEKEEQKANAGNKDIKVEKAKEVKKVPIKGKLKENKEYGKDYVIICGEIFYKIFNYFEFDILVELQKTTIFAEQNLNDEKEEKKEDKNEEKENKIDDNKDKKNIEGNVELKNVKEKLNNDNENKEKAENDIKKGEKIDIKEAEKTEDKGEEKSENKNEIIEEQNKEQILDKKPEDLKEKKEEEIIEKKEKEKEIDNNKLQKEKCDIIIEKNYIRKIEKEKKEIKEYVLDFYPIKYIEFNFSNLISIITKKYEENEYNKKTVKEKKQYEKEINRKKKEKENRRKEYLNKKDKVEKLYQQNSLDRQSALEKINILNEQYKDLDEEEITISKTNFFDVLGEELDNILSNKTNLIRKIWNQVPTKDFKNYLSIYKDKSDNENFDIIYYNKKEHFKNDEQKKILNEIDKDFILIIIDQKNKDGKTMLSTLEENENAKDTNKDKSGKKSQDLLSKEELRKMKEEKEQREKLKKQKEREEKEKLAKLEREKRKANEKITHPPYGIPNFGNTCYFNSVNQIILNLPIMQHLFSIKDLKYMINKENKFGYKGKLVSAFMPLYELYPYQIDDNVRNLKSIVGKSNETFNNTQQQDANEYLNFILEGLHEELNIKSSKVYIVDNDDNYKFNTEDELGDLAWANHQRRNTSFIDSIFLFQLKSNLTCQVCKTRKVNFESSYVFNLPLSLCKLVTVHINLFRLPFKYKVYYAKINEEFKKYKESEENKDKNIKDILLDYYSMKLNFEQKKEHAVYLSFEFDYEREKSIGDIVKLLRNIPLLELEREETSINSENEEIKEYKIMHDTELITYFTNSNKIIKNDVIIDKFVDINDKIQLNIYEVLNTNGFNKINKEYIQNQNYNLLSYKFNKKSDIVELKNQISIYINKNKEIEKSNDNEKVQQDKIQVDPSLNDNKEKENKNEIVKINNILSINDKLLYIDIPKKPSENSKTESNPSKKGKKKDKKKDKQKDKPKEKKKSNKSSNPQDDNIIIKDKENLDWNILDINKDNSDNKEDKSKKEIDNSKKEENKDNSKNDNHEENISYEFIIPIVHFRRDLAEGSSTIFQDFNYQKINDFPLQLMILNNSDLYKLSPISLYNYIWDYNSLYMNHPRKPTNDFWFNIKSDSNQQYKKCYPFVIRIVKENVKYSFPYKCSKCYWYNFCIGCILNPNQDEKALKLESDDIIFVDWCNAFIKEEIDSQNFYYKNISNEEITLSIESAVKNDKDNKYQSISDCFDLFFEKEALEDPLSCRHCGGPQNFFKNYEINKLPHVLILALKRFKYNENMNFKLKQLITFPLDDFKLKDKTYNLFGVVYHYGGINSGHYVCAIRKENKWILCDDNRVYEIEPKRVMSSNAYILFYISQESINNSSYFNCMKSLLHHMSMDKSKNIQNVKDGNFFKGEPVRSQSKGIGYVVEDYIEDFIIDKENKEKIEDKNKQDGNEIVIEENEEEINKKKDGKVKVKFELIKDVESLDKNQIEKLILVDEQKKDNKK